MEGRPKKTRRGVGKGALESNSEVETDEVLWIDEAIPVPIPTSNLEDEMWDDPLTDLETEEASAVEVERRKRKRKGNACGEYTVKPKHCTLLAYGKFAAAIGPPAHYSTLITETKNGLMSRFMASHRNFKNPIHSLREYVELLEPCTYSTCPDAVILGRLQVWSRHDINPAVLAVVEGDNECPVRAKGCQVRGIEFRAKDYVAYYPTSNGGIDNFEFGRLQVVVACEDERVFKLIVTRQERKEHEVMAAWEVDDTGFVETVPLRNLACHCPFSAITVGGKVMLSKVAAPTVENHGSVV